MGHAYRIEPLDWGERIHFTRTLAGRPLKWVSAYRVGDVLVDTGCPAAAGGFQEYLVREGAPRAVICTHEHEDHTGNLHLALGAGAEAYAPPDAVRVLEAPGRLPLYRRIAWGAHPPTPGVHPLGRDARVADERFRVIPTPGHSRDHVAFLDTETGVAYTGDAYLGKLRLLRQREDVHAQMRSLRRLLDLEPEAVCPSHGRIVRKPLSDMEDTLQYLEGLRDRARALASRGKQPREIRRDLLGPEPFLTWFSAGAFSAQNLVESLLRPEDAGPVRAGAPTDG